MKINFRTSSLRSICFNTWCPQYW